MRATPRSRRCLHEPEAVRVVTRLALLVVLLAGCGATAAPVETVTITATPDVAVPTETPTETPVSDVEALEWVTPTPSPTRTRQSPTVAQRAPEWTPEPTAEPTVRVPEYGAERRRWDELTVEGDPCVMWRQDPLLLWGGAAQGASEVLDSTKWEAIAAKECG